MCLEPPGMFNKVKITNVNKIGKTYLIIRGVLCTVIYGIWYMVQYLREQVKKYLRMFGTMPRMKERER
jgi:hypothetical protein